MHLSRQREGQGDSRYQLSDSPSFSKDVQGPKSSYGPSNSSWRFFENVPDQLSTFRTEEATSVADRHLRSAQQKSIIPP